MTTDTDVSLKLRNSKGNRRGIHPNSLKALIPTQYPPGVSGNEGSGNGYSLTSELKHTLHEEAEFISPTARPKDKLWRQQIVRAMLAESAKGNVGMVKQVLDRVDGQLSDNKPPPYQDNRIINIIVSTEKAKELTENVGRRLLGKGDEDGDKPGAGRAARY